MNDLNSLPVSTINYAKECLVHKSTRTPLELRNEAVRKVKTHGALGNIDKAQIWLDRAAAFYPLTDLQVWGIRKHVGDFYFKQLDFRRIKTISGLEANEVFIPRKIWRS